jgi:hypothetical protein
MRATVVHILASLLIAIFAVGSPSPAKADCMTCGGCPIEVPAKNHAPCPEKGLVCPVTQTCASQVQKAPAPTTTDELADADGAPYGVGTVIAIKSAYLTPETAPPRA